MPGYIESSIASRGVGKKGDPAMGGESILVREVSLACDRDCEGVPFGIDSSDSKDALESSSFALMRGERRVAMMVEESRS